MKLSGLIKQLEYYRSSFGDLDVYVPQGDSDDKVPITHFTVGSYLVITGSSTWTSEGGLDDWWWSERESYKSMRKG